MAEEGLPSMLRAANGREVWFNRSAVDYVAWVAKSLQNESALFSGVLLEEFERVVRQVLVDGYCDGSITADSPDLVATIRRRIDEALANSSRPLTHSFPGWSIDVGEKTLRVGPVAIVPVRKWVERQTFAPKARDIIFSAEAPEEGWKARFFDYQLGRVEPSHRDPASKLASIIADASHVVDVAMPAQEAATSRDLARRLARAALDAIALIMENPVFHKEWILRDHPSESPVYSHITAFESGLWPPYAHKHHHRSPFSAAENRSALTDFDNYLKACGHVLNVLRDPSSSSSNIDLAGRWFTALLWASSGARESNDAMASAKFATSLDILAQAHSAYAITEMVCHLLGVDAGKKLVKESPHHPEGMTVRQAVEALYGKGRSQILHGNIVDPMHRHVLEREVGGLLARRCLRVAVQAIPGAEDARHKNFRKAF